MKKICLLCAVFLCLIGLFPGCDSHSTEPPAETEQRQNIVDLVHHIYSDEELEEILCFEGPLKELEQEYPVECLREIGSGQTVMVYYLSDTKIGFLHFDRNGEKLGYSTAYGRKHHSKEFQAIQVGDKLEDVRAFDPDGDYLFLYTDIQLPRGSTHYTTDGYCVYITYDENGTVSEIVVQMI